MMSYLRVTPIAQACGFEFHDKEIRHARCETIDIITRPFVSRLTQPSTEQSIEVLGYGQPCSVSKVGENTFTIHVPEHLIGLPLDIQYQTSTLGTKSVKSWFDVEFKREPPKARALKYQPYNDYKKKRGQTDPFLN